MINIMGALKEYFNADYDTNSMIKSGTDYCGGTKKEVSHKKLTIILYCVLCVLAGISLYFVWDFSLQKSLIDNEYYYLIRQLIVLIAGFAGMIVFSILSKKVIKIIGAAYIVLLTAMTLIAHGSGILQHVYATSYMRIGGIYVQYGHFLVLAYLIIASVVVDLLSRKKSKYYTLAFVWVIGIIATFITYKLDCGTYRYALVILFITYWLGAYVTSAFKTHGIIFSIGTVLVYVALYVANATGIVTSSIRLSSFMHPEEHYYEYGYTACMYKQLVSEGGLWGRGFGSMYDLIDEIPNATNNGMLACIQYEIGFLGMLVLGLLLALVLFCVRKLFLKEKNVFESGFAISVFVQLILYIGCGFLILYGIIPTVDVSVPFLAADAVTAFMMWEIGIVISMARP